MGGEAGDCEPVDAKAQESMKADSFREVKVQGERECGAAKAKDGVKVDKERWGTGPLKWQVKEPTATPADGKGAEVESGTPGGAAKPKERVKVEKECWGKGASNWQAKEPTAKSAAW